MKKNNVIKAKNGISLIVLIITIIVVIILAAAVILTLNKNNPIESAKEAAFKEDIRAYQDELNMYISNEYQKLGGARDKKITAKSYEKDTTKDEYNNSVYKYLTSFKKKYEGKLVIEDDELIYIGGDKKEKEWIKNIIEQKITLTIKYVFEDGKIAVPVLNQVLNDGTYKVESPILSGYEPDFYVVSGKIEKDTEIVVTYYPWSDKLQYEELGDGTYAVAGIGECTSKDIIIPREYNNKSISKIKYRAFFGTSIKSVIVPDSIKIIDSGAFLLSGIQSLVIGKNVKSLGQDFITYCRSLRSVTFRNEEIPQFSCYDCPEFKEIKIEGNENNYKVENNILYTANGETLLFCPYGKTGDIIIPNSVKKIAYRAFWGTSIKSVIVPDSIKIIDSGAFLSSGIQSLVIGKNVKSLGQDFITNCRSLRSVTFRNEEIPQFSCYGCPEFKEIKIEGNENNYKVENNILYTANGETLLFCPYGKTGDIIIPNSVKKIAYRAFWGTVIKSVTVPDSVITISDGAFQSSGIQSLVIGKNVKSIGGNTFASCGNLYEVTYNGTKIEWNSISKNGWNGSSKIKTIHCTDGDIQL